MLVCPCGSAKNYVACCGVYIDDAQLPETPEALMRSRYTAYTQNNLEYVAQTMKDAAAADFDIELTRKWSKLVKWLGLEIIQADPPAQNVDTGTVEFIARYQVRNRSHSIHEISEFKRDEGRWFYIDGKSGQPQQIEKIRRNDPCSCNSGKKYKKCCGS